MTDEKMPKRELEREELIATAKAAGAAELAIAVASGLHTATVSRSTVLKVLDREVGVIRGEARDAKRAASKAAGEKARKAEARDRREGELDREIAKSTQTRKAQAREAKAGKAGESDPRDTTSRKKGTARVDVDKAKSS